MTGAYLRRRPGSRTERPGSADRPSPLILGTVTHAREQLIEHIKADAVFHGDFTLTSGKQASYYIDLRKVSLDHRVAPSSARS